VGHRQSSSAVLGRRIAFLSFGSFALPRQIARADVGKSAHASFYSLCANRPRVSAPTGGAEIVAASGHAGARRVDCRCKPGALRGCTVQLRIRNSLSPARHCEERSGESIQDSSHQAGLVRFVRSDAIRCRRNFLHFRSQPV